MVNFRRRWSLQASQASEDARSRSPSVRIVEAAERADSLFQEHSPLLSEDARSWSPSFFNAASRAGSPLRGLADSDHGLDPAPERSSGSDGWERVGSALPQDPGPVLSSEVQRAVVYQRDVSLPKLPYEHGIWGLVFGSPASLPTTRFPAPVGPRPQPIPTPPDPSTNSLELSSAAAPPDISLARIKAATFRVTDAALRDRCLVQLKTLLLLDPSATKTGIQMTTCFGKILEPDRALLVLQDTLRPKATGTISKRTGSLWRLAHYLASVDGRSPFMVSEPLLYEYLCSLREADSGATSGASALEALRFADGLFRFQRISLREVDSARIRGVAHAMYVRKQKRKQAPALTVRAIRFLMAWCCDPSRPLHTRIISGHLLACIFAVARWSDLRFLAFFRVLSDDEFSIFESATSQHKTAHSKEAQVELLPFIGLGQWPGCESWAACLATLRAESDLSQGLPSWNEREQKWALGDPMTTSEATGWLREILSHELDPTDVRALRAHSCKTTLLAWAGVSPLFTREERTLLGHHIEASTRSATTYDRQAIIRLQAKVWHLLISIDSGELSPDADALGRLRSMVQVHAPRPASAQTSEEPASSSSSDDEPAGLPAPLHRDRVPLPAAAYEYAWLVHSVSGIVHVQSPHSPERLMCGSLPIELGLAATFVQELHTGGIDTYASLAFCQPHQANSGIDDVALMRHVGSLVSSALSAHQTTALRRLAFEAQALALQDLRSKLERTSDSEPKVLPLQEKLERSSRLQNRLVGVTFTDHNQPAHALVDKASQQFDEGVLQYLQLNKCISRYQEALAERSSASLRFGSDGAIKVSRESAGGECDISTAHLLRAAFQRRAMAYDIAGVATYEALDAWAQNLFDRLSTPVPSSRYSPIGLEQILAADKALWVRLSQLSRGLLGRSDAATGALLVDNLILDLSNHPEVVWHFLPLANASHTPPPKPHAAQAARKRKRQRASSAPPVPAASPGRTPAKGPGKGSGAGSRIQVPDGCTIRFSKGPICMKYNLGTCRASHVKPGARCSNGYHVCWKIGGGVWYESPSGTSHRLLDGVVTPGCVLDVASGPVFLPAAEARHQTLLWEGTRCVLVAFTSLDAHTLCPADLDTLSRAGFSCGAPGMPNALPPVPQTSLRPMAVELCAGSASLSAALRAAGFATLAVDHHWNTHPPQHSICQLDLSCPQQQALLLRWMRTQPLAHVPMPYSGSLLDVLELAASMGATVSLENPSRSWLWSALRAMAEESQRVHLLAQLEECIFDSCMHGGRRKKSTKILGSPGLFSSLRASCDSSHTHAPWTVDPTASGPRFATAEEAQYPRLLCLRMAQALAARHQLPEPVPTASASLSQSVRRGSRPLIPEFYECARVPAASLCSPTNPGQVLPTVLKDAVDTVLTTDPVDTAKRRLQAVITIKQLAKELEGKEDEFKSSLDPDVASILSPKKLCIPLVGTHGREAMIQSRKIPSDQHQNDLVSASMEEVSRGDLKGPLTESDAHQHFGSEHWLLNPRFPIYQGVSLKLRVIDDAKASGLNSAFSPSYKVKLMDIDVLACLVAHVASGLHLGHCDGNPVHHLVASSEWEGGTLDLARAYKQVPIDPASRPFCVVGFPTSEGWQYYRSDVLPFGSNASVYAFLRISRALHHVLVKFLAALTTVFYDDFPIIEPAMGAPVLKSAVSAVLDCLGWAHSKDGDKALQFAGSFVALGVLVDLRGIRSAKFRLSNKPGRIDRLVEMIQQFSDEGRVDSGRLSILQGHLNFAAGFYMAKGLRFLSKEFAKLLDGRRSTSEIRALCRLAIALLRGTPEREFDLAVTGQPVIIFTDGSWEGGRAGAGGVVFDPATEATQVFELEVPGELLAAWQQQVGTQLICQIEAYAAISARYLLRHVIRDRLAVMWIDNEASRVALSKGTADSESLRAMARVMQSIEISHPSVLWYERVCSFSNPADMPSRGDAEAAARLFGGRVVDLGSDGPVRDAILLAVRDPYANLVV
ncbi:unnamed protein product [Symbiodinium sp. CCMP2592]|nr:unnamed protein product [Symbiodinium sp. CCMP2592]